jgi:small multidrug resistance pump
MSESIMVHWFALVSAVLVSVLAQTLLKSGAFAPSFPQQLLDWHTLGGLFFYCLASPLYIVALRRIPISVAMPFTAISYVMAALIGRFWFAEALGAAQVVGISLIALGVLAMTLSAQT